MSDYNHSEKAWAILKEYGEAIALEEITSMLKLFEVAGLDTIAYDFRKVLEELHKITGIPQPTDVIH